MANVVPTSLPETFAAGLEGAPRTPTSLSSTSGGPTPRTQPSGGPDNSSLLRSYAPSHAQKAAGLATARQATASLSPKSNKPQTHLSPRSTPLPLTGIAAIADMKRQKQAHQGQALISSRQTSPNPPVQAMQSLLGAGGMSKPTDAPAPDKMSSPLRRVAEKMSVPDSIAHTATEQDASPVSLGSFGSTLEGSGMGGPNNAMTITAGDHNPHQQSQFVAEPSQMGDDQLHHSNNNGNHAHQHHNNDKNSSVSYPGLPPQSDQGQEEGPSRSMTLPGSGYGHGSPKSPAGGSGKRHKCPYCSTDFTRHHNLKSHLLTHSQEKPYVCQTCQARFRRLHDLKRHTKLHTGERPHTCDKCGRKFARGDALARHNKGPGGCAGRRSSLGGDDDFDGDGDGMDGIEYDNDESAMEEHGRRVSEPNRKRQQLETPQDSNRQVYRQLSSTYPPPPRQMQGNMGPPQVVHPGGSGSATSPRDMSGQPSPAGGSMSSSYYGQGQVFAEPGMMTHSPKPLSPGQNQQDMHRLSVDNSAQLGRNRSTSLTTQFQQAHFGRGSVGGAGNRTPPQPNSQLGANQQTPHNILPPLSSTSQAQNRTVMQPSIAPNNMSSNNNMMGSHPAQYSTAPSNPSSLSSHGRSSGSSIRDITGQDPNDIWQYVRQLEQKFSRMQDEYELRISRLQEEVIALRGQVGQISNAGSYSSDIVRQGPYA